MGRRNQDTIDDEVDFASSEELVSTTDPRGVITYANDAFCSISGYSRDELIGKNHNMVRHPDMPKEAFFDLWQHLKQGQPWRGAVKNRCKDGRYYWVDAFVTPIYSNGEITGYQSVRRTLDTKYKSAATKMYKRVKQGKPIRSKSVDLFEKYKLLLFLVCGIPIIYLTSYSYLFAILLLLMPLLLFRDEIFRMARYTKEQQDKYDSVSRYVYSGDKPNSVCDFHVKLLEGQIRTIIGRVIDSSHILADGSTSLNNTVTQLKNSTEQGVGELLQISTASEEMTQTIDEVAQNTVSSSHKMEQAHRDCEAATKAMRHTMDEVNALAKEVEESATSAIGLSTEVEKISDIMHEIKGISEQTNLLALNAAIEAARAGEHGRGFAVVADEVRALSTRTQSATEQIHTSVSEIHTTLISWSKKMESGKEAAETCAAEAQETELLVAKVYDTISDISDLTMQISTATEQQSMVSQEVTRNISNLRDASTSNLEQTEGVNDQASVINRLSHSLASLALSFRVN
ncbi:chemotaxis protein [Vibrio genomosp. F10 str. ZF-129]|uniref:Chemotaxis protein n=3 Tax=Vibrio genomosp. F10 TaxID=723171 RepID=A0A1E5BBF5_9VIBR|nr:PAS domain-containing methyl-accepting chemotaxis protein [Vibrio genomosp. F10]OEE31491.1 chemotaxis protein [Vibrio genomosp. F10 str. ZF-129]